MKKICFYAYSLHYVQWVHLLLVAAMMNRV